MSMSFISYLINGLSLGSVYAIIALGYTMVYGIAKMLNFAHGDVIMIGAYTALIAISQKGLSPVIGVLIAVVVCTVLGVVIERRCLPAAPKCIFIAGSADYGYRRQLSASEYGAPYIRTERADISVCN